MIIHSTNRLVKPILIAPVLAAFIAGCGDGLFSGQDAEIGLVLPAELRLGDLTPEQKDNLRAGFSLGQGDEITERQLSFNGDFTRLSGTLVLDSVDEELDTTFTIRVYGRYAALSPEVILTQAEGRLQIIPNQDNTLEIGTNDFQQCGPLSRDALAAALDSGAEVEGCPLVLDENRNGLSNVVDFHEGIDPVVSTPLVDVAPQTLQFPSGIRLGDFARQVVVLENTTEDTVDIDVSVVGGNGVSVAQFEVAGQEVGQEEVTGRTLTFTDVGPFSEVYVAVSFAPVNTYFTTGAMHVSVTNQRSFVNHSSRVKIIANADGELAPPGDGFDVDLAADAITGFDGPVATFPEEELASGLSITGASASSDAVSSGLLSSGQEITALFAVKGEGTQEITLAADQGFLLQVPGEYSLDVNLDGLQADVDLALVALDASGDVVSDSPLNQISQQAGDGPEAIIFDNPTDDTQRLLLVLGRADSAEAQPGSTPGALTISEDEAASFNLSAQLSNSPEFLAPPDEDSPILPSGRGAFEGGNRISLWGRGFQDGATVLMADKVATDCVWEEPADYPEYTTISCTVPPGSLEVGKNPATIVVANPPRSLGGDGQAATAPNGYYYLPPAPRVDQLSPALGTVDGGDEIIIQGAFFSVLQGLPRVWFGSEFSPDVVFLDPSTLSVFTPPAAMSGVVEVRVENCLQAENFLFPEEGACLEYSSSAGSAVFSYLTPQSSPTLTGVSPATGPIDGSISGALDVTLSGTDFLEPVSVYFGTQQVSEVSFDSSTTIRVSAPSVTEDGPVDIKVVNGDGAQVILQDGYTYDIPAPNMTQVTPAQASVDESIPVAIDGTGFRSGATVQFVLGDSAYDAATIFWLSTDQLLVGTPVVNEAGAYTIVVTNPDGQETTLDGFNYFSPSGPPPYIKGMTPDSGLYTVSTSSVMWGTDFSDSSISLLVNSTPVQPDARGPCCEGAECVVAFCAAGDDYVSFTVPPATGPGNAVVRLVNDDGQSDTVSFTYAGLENPAPEISSSSPGQGLAGTEVTVNGVNIDASDNQWIGTAGLTVGGQAIALSHISTLSPTTVVFTMPDLGVPAGEQLQVSIRITNDDGQSAAVPFTLLGDVIDTPPGPTIFSAVPSVADLEDLFAFALFGEHFQEGATVSYLGESVSPGDCNDFEGLFFEHAASQEDGGSLDGGSGDGGLAVADAPQCRVVFNCAILELFEVDGGDSDLPWSPQDISAHCVDFTAAFNDLFGDIAEVEAFFNTRLTIQNPDGQSAETMILLSLEKSGESEPLPPSEPMTIDNVTPGQVTPGVEQTLTITLSGVDAYVDAYGEGDLYYQVIVDGVIQGEMIPLFLAGTSLDAAVTLVGAGPAYVTVQLVRMLDNDGYEVLTTTNEYPIDILQAPPTIVDYHPNPVIAGEAFEIILGNMEGQPTPSGVSLTLNGEIVQTDYDPAEFSSVINVPADQSATEGQYSVELTLSFDGGPDPITLTDTVEMVPPPTPYIAGLSAYPVFLSDDGFQIFLADLQGTPEVEVSIGVRNLQQGEFEYDSDNDSITIYQDGFPGASGDYDVVVTLDGAPLETQTLPFRNAGDDPIIASIDPNPVPLGEEFIITVADVPQDADGVQVTIDGTPLDSGGFDSEASYSVPVGAGEYTPESAGVYTVEVQYFDGETPTGHPAVDFIEFEDPNAPAIESFSPEIVSAGPMTESLLITIANSENINQNAVQAEVSIDNQWAGFFLVDNGFESFTIEETITVSDGLVVIYFLDEQGNSVLELVDFLPIEGQAADFQVLFNNPEELHPYLPNQNLLLSGEGMTEIASAQFTVDDGGTPEVLLTANVVSQTNEIAVLEIDQESAELHGYAGGSIQLQLKDEHDQVLLEDWSIPVSHPFISTCEVLPESDGTLRRDSGKASISCEGPNLFSNQMQWENFLLEDSQTSLAVGWDGLLTTGKDFFTVGTATAPIPGDQNAIKVAYNPWYVVTYSSGGLVMPPLEVTEALISKSIDQQSQVLSTTVELTMSGFDSSWINPSYCSYDTLRMTPLAGGVTEELILNDASLPISIGYDGASEKLTIEPIDPDDFPELGAGPHRADLVANCNGAERVLASTMAPNGLHLSTLSPGPQVSFSDPVDLHALSYPQTITLHGSGFSDVASCQFFDKAGIEIDSVQGCIPDTDARLVVDTNGPLEDSTAASEIRFLDSVGDLLGLWEFPEDLTYPIIDRCWHIPDASGRYYFAGDAEGFANDVRFACSGQNLAGDTTLVHFNRSGSYNLDGISPATHDILSAVDVAQSHDGLLVGIQSNVKPWAVYDEANTLTLYYGAQEPCISSQSPATDCAESGSHSPVLGVLPVGEISAIVPSVAALEEGSTEGNTLTLDFGTSTDGSLNTYYHVYLIEVSSLARIGPFSVDFSAEPPQATLDEQEIPAGTYGAEIVFNESERTQGTVAARTMASSFLEDGSVLASVIVAPVEVGNGCEAVDQRPGREISTPQLISGTLDEAVLDGSGEPQAVCGQEGLYAHRYLLDVDALSPGHVISLIPQGDQTAVAVYMAAVPQVDGGAGLGPCESAFDAESCALSTRPDDLQQATSAGFDYDLLIVGPEGTDYSFIVSITDINGDCLDPGGTASLNVDLDTDTYTICHGDCNDADATVNPMAMDTCDGVDRNCDGLVDVPVGLTADVSGWTGESGVCGQYMNLACDGGGNADYVPFVKPYQYQSELMPYETLSTDVDESCTGAAPANTDFSAWFSGETYYPESDLLPARGYLEQAFALPLTEDFLKVDSGSIQLDSVTTSSLTTVLAAEVGPEGLIYYSETNGLDDHRIQVYDPVTGLTTQLLNNTDKPYRSLAYREDNGTHYLIYSITTGGGAGVYQGALDENSQYTTFDPQPSALDPSTLSVSGIRRLEVANDLLYYTQGTAVHSYNLINGTGLTLNSFADQVHQLAASPDGNYLYVTRAVANQISQIDLNSCQSPPCSTVTEIAGDGAQGCAAEGALATGQPLTITADSGLWVDAAGNLLFADTGCHRIRMIDNNGDGTNDGKIYTVAGNGIIDDPTTTGILATDDTINFPKAVAVDPVRQRVLVASSEAPPVIYGLDTYFTPGPTGEKRMVYESWHNTSLNKDYFALELESGVYVSAHLSLRPGDFIDESGRQGPCYLLSDPYFQILDNSVRLLYENGEPVDPLQEYTFPDRIINETDGSTSVSTCGAIENLYIAQGGRYILEVRFDGLNEAVEGSGGVAPFRLDISSAPVKSGQAPFCGDGIVQQHEECDFLDDGSFDEGTQICSRSTCEIGSVQSVGGGI